MFTKKTATLFAMAFAMFGTTVFAQNGDTSKIWNNNAVVAKKNAQAFNDFATNSAIYPARPRDMWEIGLGAGVVTMSGDLRNDPGIGYTFTLRKSLSHIFSLRPYYSYYSVKGNADNIASSYAEARNYKTRAWGLGVDILGSLNTIRSYKGNPKFNAYLMCGFGVIFNQVKKDYAKDGNYVNWYGYPNFGTLGSIGDKVNDNGKKAIIPTFNVGGGIAYKLTDRFNIGLETKNSLTNYDWLDGFSSQFSNAFDAYWFTSLRLNYNIGKKDKRLQPLWWINPNNYVYNELNNPQHLKNKLKVKLDDADADGVTDQFDLEPNTPAGVAVDSHGRAIDSDGDGIPDYKDKELLTRQECFPSNADGVGQCPESPCCKTVREQTEILQRTIDSIKNGTLNVVGGTGGNCGLNNLPSIVYKSGSSLSRDNMKLLDAVAQQMKNTPSCKVKVIGHPEANKASQQKAYDRVASIIKYLVEKQGINEGRFIFAYDAGTSGDGNTIDLQGTTEEGPNTVPAPAPHLSGKN